MNPLSSRARAEELARLLEGAAPADPAAASLVRVADRVRSFGTELGPVVAPRAEFRATLRTRLVAVASVQAVNAETAAPVSSTNRALESAVSWAQSRRAQRRLSFAAGSMASVVALTGVAVAGSKSLPGDPFYGVKRGGEALELRTTHGDVAKGSKHLQFAAERLKEVRGLSLGRDAAFSGPTEHPLAADAFGGSSSSRVRSALADMDRETTTGSQLLTSAYRSSNSDAPLKILSRFAGKQTRELQTLLPALPAAARDRAQVSLALVSGVAADTSELLAVGVCTGACAPTQTAPTLPPVTGPMPQPVPNSNSQAPCGCPQPEPTRTTNPQPQPSPSPSPQPTTAPSPQPSPSPSPSGSPGPLPTDLPTPLPTPLPTILPTTLPTPLPTGLPSALPVPVPSLPALPAVPLG
ncbi:MAG: hypothetical protein QOI82_3125 [Actinomycetota bacterium]|jgi:hypothetical protein|nr:hypothetical protein [Actinomycetota bacterium]